jgi:hypothetical protein
MTLNPQAPSASPAILPSHILFGEITFSQNIRTVSTAIQSVAEPSTVNATNTAFVASDRTILKRMMCRVLRPRRRHVTIIGPACFAGDVVYRNKLMPDVRPGEVIAIMDSGAYFTAMESSFGFPRPAIAAVNESGCRLVRKREQFKEMISRDVLEYHIS